MTVTYPIFLPSTYSSDLSGPRPSDAAVGRDVTAGTLSAAGAGLTGVKAATVIAGGGAAAGGAAAAGSAGAAGTLAAAAGASATVPVAGWVVGGVLAVAAGTVALVQGIKKRRLNKASAIKWAKKLNLPDPEEVPGFVLKLSRKDRKWRDKVRARYVRRLERNQKRQAKWEKRPGGRRVLQVLTLGAMRGPERLKKQEHKLKTRIELIDALNQTYEDKRESRRKKRAGDESDRAPMSAVSVSTTPEPEIQEEPAWKRDVAGAPAWAWALVGVATVGGFVWMQKNKNKKV